ncbi:MAG: peroxiredoxin family protein, partial [Pirellulaceae bacterium]
LVNTHDQPITLSDLNRRGPVILVFYYGYYCSHCVAQLFGLQKDLEYIRELGAEVVAISADTPESTRGKYTEYGGFTFPVLSDQDYRVSEAWGVYVRPSINRSEDLLHGTFVIDRAGKVIFARRGYQPFVDNKSLLYWLADENGRGRSPSTTASPGFRRESR